MLLPRQFSKLYILNYPKNLSSKKKRVGQQWRHVCLPSQEIKACSWFGRSEPLRNLMLSFQQEGFTLTAVFLGPDVEHATATIQDNFQLVNSNKQSTKNSLTSPGLAMYQSQPLNAKSSCWGCGFKSNVNYPGPMAGGSGGMCSISVLHPLCTYFLQIMQQKSTCEISEQINVLSLFLLRLFLFKIFAFFCYTYF